MNENHIVDLLERSSVASLSVVELETVKAHTAVCRECLLAYQAAQASIQLLQSRTAVTVTPSPFFQTKVMAAIREQKLSPKQSGFLTTWKTAEPLVAFMGAIVVMLLALTFFNGSEPSVEPSALTSADDSSPEWVVLDSDDAGVEMTYSQALAVLYDPAMEVTDADGE